MNIDQVFTWILNHPLNYPGKCQQSQPRTNPAYKPLEPKAQFHIVFKAACEYIKEKMLNGKGVNIRNFGAFTFEVISDKIKPAQFSNFDITKDLYIQRAERKHIHKIRPCFIPDHSLKYSLKNYKGKEEITAPKSQHSIYQKGFGMIVCNSGPISAACFLSKDLVNSILDAFIRAITDLIDLNYDLGLDFGYAKLDMFSKNLKYEYKCELCQIMNESSFELKMRRSDTPTSDLWTGTYEDKKEKSTMYNILRRPVSQEVRVCSDKTLALKIMSLDLNTTEKVKYSKNKLPPITNNKKNKN